MARHEKGLRHHHAWGGERSSIIVLYSIGHGPIRAWHWYREDKKENILDVEYLALGGC